MTGWRPIALTFVAGMALTQPSARAMPDTSGDPFAWLQPAVSVDAAARHHLDRGDTVIRVLPSSGGELGIFATSRLEAPPGMAGAWAASIADLKVSPYVLNSRRFSNPPVLEDLDGLDLDEGDLESVRSCKPGSCGLKLGATEIQALRTAADAGGAQWKDDVRRRFRQLVLDRVNAYRAEGLAGLPPYVDRTSPVDPKAALGVLLDDSPYLRSDALGGDGARVDSYFYWSTEYFGTGKPVIAVTHVDLVRGNLHGAPAVAAIGEAILATHYRNAALDLTALVGDHTGQAYLVYINRAQVDMLGGALGGLTRTIVERRLKNEIGQAFGAARRRLESESPAQDHAAATGPAAP